MTENRESSNTATSIADDEIDLLEFIKILWKGKYLIIVITVLITAMSVIFALNLPNKYKASALVAPMENNNASGLAGLAQKFGALSGANIQLGNKKINKTAIAMAVLRSRFFITNFIKEHNISVPLMAVKEWHKSNNQVFYKDDVYDIDKKQWLIEVNDRPIGSPPSDELLYKEFMEILSVETNEKTGFVTVSIEFPIPASASQWVRWLISDLNEYMRQQEIRSMKVSIRYLKDQLEKTTVVEIRNTFFELIKEQVQRGLIAKTEEEYILKTIDPATVPEKKVGPRRMLIVILGGLCGGLLGVIIVVFQTSIQKMKKLKSSEV